MAKYRAKVDIPPVVTAGMIVEANAPLIPEFQSKLEAVTEGEIDIPVSEEDPVNPDTPVEGAEATETTETTEKTPVINPDREALKEEARNLGITFASNIPTDKLFNLVQEAREEKKKADEAAEAQRLADEEAAKAAANNQTNDEDEE